MNRKKILVLFVLLWSVIVKAQNKNLATSTIPFNLIDKQYVLIKTVVNDKDTLTFYFDTGATSSLLDKSSAEKLGIKPNYEQEVDGAGGKTKYQVALNQKVSINGIKLDSVHLVLEDLTRLKEALDHNFDGIIGYSLINKFITELDFDSQEIRLYPKDIKLDLSNYSKLDFTFDNGIPIPQFDVEIELKNSKKYRGKVLFDSGAGLVLLINTPFKEKNNLISQSKKILSSVSENLSKSSIIQEIAIKQLKIGEFSFSNLPITLSSDEAGVSSYEQYLGILGAEIIKRFNIILDYGDKKIYLKPNNFYKNAFDFSFTGFTMDKNDKGEMYISEISIEGSAYRKGIRKGDIIVSIDGNSNANIFSELLKQEGKKVKILLKQGDKLVKVKLKLERLL